MRLRRNKYRETDELHEEVVGRQRRRTPHLRMDLEAALERLPEVSRAVVWLHDVEGYTHDEIAGMMGKTPSFSKSQLARAHARLRRWLGEEVDRMTHLTMEALLSLREPGTEPGEAAAREHLEGCPACRAELDRLHQRVARLKALPALRPSRDRWPTVRAPGPRRAPAAAVSRRRAGRARGRGLDGPRRWEWPASGRRSSGPDRAGDPAGHGAVPGAGERPGPVSTPRAGCSDGRTAGIAQELEDRIARVDRELEMAELTGAQARDAQLLRLWRERVGLLDALVDVHVTRASNVGL